MCTLESCMMYVQEGVIVFCSTVNNVTFFLFVYLDTRGDHPASRATAQPSHRIILFRAHFPVKPRADRLQRMRATSSTREYRPRWREQQWIGAGRDADLGCPEDCAFGAVRRDGGPLERPAFVQGLRAFVLFCFESVSFSFLNGSQAICPEIHWRK